MFFEVSHCDSLRFAIIVFIVLAAIETAARMQIPLYIIKKKKRGISFIKAQSPIKPESKLKCLDIDVNVTVTFMLLLYAACSL